MEESAIPKTIVLSGIRATGKLHLGNFLGVLRDFARLSRDPNYRCYFFVADWHTLTTFKEAGQIRENLSNIVLDYLAAGVDPKSATIFVQSGIPETAELFWYLCCLTPKGELERIPTFKDKARLHPEDVNAGLLNYPVLMAADILGPKAEFIPVGKDQKPHLEMAANLARHFNRLCGYTFPIPQPLERGMIIVPGLDGSGKMGKSEGNTINLDDSSEIVRRKVKKAVTDPARKRRSDPGNPGCCNIFIFHSLLSTTEQISECAEGCRTAKIGCSECKEIVAQHIINLLVPFQEKRREAATIPGLVEIILAEGTKQMRGIIRQTVEEVRKKIGVVRF